MSGSVALRLVYRIRWLIFAGLLVLASVAVVDWSDIAQTGAASSLRMFGSALVSPDLSSKNLWSVSGAVWTTLAYATTALSVAIVVGIPLGVIASGTMLPTGSIGCTVAISVRAYLGFVRTIHELIWALLFVVAFGLSPAVGILAIGIPYSGIIGRILAERLQDVPENQVTAAQFAGATKLQQIAFVRIPSVLPDMISYLFYRFECAVRTAAVLSFVGLGGIGFRIDIAMKDLDFSAVATLLYCLVVLVLAVDLVSGSVRKRLLA
jgi:phosphonate transport system permease protein